MVNGKVTSKQKFAFDIKSLKIQSKFKEREIAVSESAHRLDERCFELDREKLEVEKLRLSSVRDPLYIAIGIAMIGLIGNGVVALVNSVSQRAVERQKIQGDLIQGALKTEGNTALATENLRLLAEAGLVDLYEPRLVSYLEDLDRRRQEVGGGALGPATSTGSVQNNNLLEIPSISGDEISPSQSSLGDRGSGVLRVQEWLSLKGYRVPITGNFDEETHAALKKYSKDNGIEYIDEVTEELDRSLKGDLIDLINLKIDVSDGDVGATMRLVAEAYLERHPREVGGQNKGPWVRYFMGGNQGRDWPWSAGFVLRVMQDAYRMHGSEAPIKGSFSIDTFVAQAKQAGMYRPGTEVKNGFRPTPGDFFVVRRTSTDWTHIGVVVDVGENSFETVEGNTNDDGSREGYEVAKRTRGFDKKDFIVFSD